MALAAEHSVVLPQGDTASSDGAVDCVECHNDPYAKTVVDANWQLNTGLEGQCADCHNDEGLGNRHQTRSSAHDALANPSCDAGCHAYDSTDIENLHGQAEDAEGRTSCLVCHTNGADTDLAGSSCGVGGTCHTDKAAGNHGAGTAHSFSAASDYNNTGVAGCTNSGAGCHNGESTYASFAAYHPGSGCLGGACHTSPSKATYSGSHECVSCHDGSFVNAPKTEPLHAPAGAGHYGETTHTATGLATTVSAGGTASANCNDCHNATNLGNSDVRQLYNQHQGLPSPYVDTTCVDCHNKNVQVTSVVTNKWPTKRCDACHNSAVLPMLEQHGTTAPIVNATSAQSCGASGSGCHTTYDVHALHKNAAGGCTIAGCHNASLQAAKPTARSCGTGGSCHTSDPHDPTAHDATLGSGDIDMQMDTHDNGNMIIEEPCALCHYSSLIDQHGGQCSVCHSGSNPAGGLGGTWNKTCQQAACHPSLHNRTSTDHFGTFWNSSSSCALCHDSSSEWPGPATGCSTCHSPASTAISGPDTTPPTTTSSIVGGATYVGPQTFALSPSDAGGSGVAGTWWQLDSVSGAWTPGTSVPVSAPASGGAAHQLYWYSRDNSGNQEATRSVGFTIAAPPFDGTAPTGSVSVNAGATYTNVTAVMLTLSASDTGGSGLSQMRFSNDGVTFSAWETYATSKSWTLAPGDGVKTVYVQFRDNANNVSTSYSDDIALDGTAPTGSVSVNAGATYTNVTAVMLTLSASDTGGSGLSQMRFSNDGVTFSAWETYATSKSWTLASGDGVKTVYVQFRDNANNVSTSYSDDIALDGTAPTGSVSVNAGATYTNVAAVMLTLSASDTGGSGLSQMRFSNDGVTFSAWETYATSKSWTLAPGDGVKTVYVQFRDNANNVSTSYSDAITLDSTAPTTTNSAAAGAVYSGAQLFTLTPTDSGSGVASTWYQLDGGAWTLGSAIAVAAPASGSALHTVNWYSVDVATNQEVTKTVAFTVSASSGTTTLSATLTTSSSNHAYAHFIFYDENGAVIGDPGWGLDEHTSSYSLVVPAGHAYTMYVEWEPPEYETFPAGSDSRIVTAAETLPGATVSWTVNYE